LITDGKEHKGKTIDDKGMRFQGKGTDSRVVSNDDPDDSKAFVNDGSTPVPIRFSDEETRLKPFIGHMETDVGSATILCQMNRSFHKKVQHEDELSVGLQMMLFVSRCWKGKRMASATIRHASTD